MGSLAEFQCQESKFGGANKRRFGRQGIGPKLVAGESPPPDPRCPSPSSTPPTCIWAVHFRGLACATPHSGRATRQRQPRGFRGNHRPRAGRKNRLRHIRRRYFRWRLAQFRHRPVLQSPDCAARQGGRPELSAQGQSRRQVGGDQKPVPARSGAKISRPARPHTFELPDLRVALHGRGFAHRAENENIARAYPPPKPGWFNIGVLHTSLDGRARPP